MHFLRAFFTSACVSNRKFFVLTVLILNIAFGAYRRQKKEENGRPEEGQEVQRVDQLSTGPRHEVGQVRAGLQADAEDPPQRQVQAGHHCQQHSPPQVHF